MILAVFTYQVAYWSWIKLEADEARDKIDGKFYPAMIFRNQCIGTRSVI